MHLPRFPSRLRAGSSALAIFALLVVCGSFDRTCLAAPDAAAPDRSGESQFTPTTGPTGSVPGYPAGGTRDAAVDSIARAVSRDFRSINFVWTLTAGFLVMFMQAGFALIETGLCRVKNAAHTMSMNFLVYALGMLSFFVCGFAFMCGGINDIPPGHTAPPIGGPATLGLDRAPALDRMLYITAGGRPWGLLGLSGFGLAGRAYDVRVAVWFLYMMVFMDTTATIPTGAAAERWRFKSFTIFSLCVGAFIYPVYGCWMWGGGWLAQLGQNLGLAHGAVDYAGSSVVHLQGGVLALVLSWMLGPRIGKYDSRGRPQPIFGHHIPMVMFGTLLLAFGWFGFNAGSTLSGASGRIGLIAVNTMLASCGGTLVAAFYMWKVYGSPDPSMMCNGMLGGLVAITAPCAFVSPIAALVIGTVAGLLVTWSVLLLERRGLDDPVGAVSVHGVGGLWGLLAVGLFADGTFGEGYNGVAGNVVGLFHGGGFRQLGAQCIAAVACITWNALVGAAVFRLIGQLIGGNRVSPEVELTGLDVPELGAPGYPEFTTQGTV
jgi:ammonium transporter, Amt family